jgi:hypothetical protein
MELFNLFTRNQLVISALILVAAIINVLVFGVPKY